MTEMKRFRFAIFFQWIYIIFTLWLHNEFTLNSILLNILIAMKRDSKDSLNISSLIIPFTKILWFYKIERNWNICSNTVINYYTRSLIGQRIDRFETTKKCKRVWMYDIHRKSGKAGAQYLCHLVKQQ